MSKKEGDIIHTGKFRNEYHKAVVNLIVTYNHVSEKLRDILQTEDLTMQQFNILRILRGVHPEASTNTHIKERLLDKNSDVTRIVDRLIKRDLVSRGYCSNDRRKVEICITEKGLNVLARLDHFNQDEDAILKVLDEKEVKQLNTILNRIRE